MLYYYKKDVDEPGFECTKFCVLLLTNTVDGQVTQCYTTESILNNMSLLNEERQYGCDVYVSVLPNESVPIVVLNECKDASRVANITPFYDILCKSYDNNNHNSDLPASTLKALKEKIAGILGNADEALRVITATKAQYDWLHTEEPELTLLVDNSLIDPEFRSATRTLIDKLNAAQTSAFAGLDPFDNVTVFQHVCTDPLFVELPTRMKLLDEETELTSLMPIMKNVCVPYTDKNAYLPEYKKLNVPQYLWPMIEGEASNNELPIQENEKAYYDALVSWVEFNMKEEYGAAAGSVIDSLSQSYLSELITTLYMWHWGHNPYVPVEVNDKGGTDDVGDAVSSRYVFRQIDGASTIQRNAVMELLDFLEEVSTSQGYLVYPLAVIQLARWGERKQTCIVFEDCDYVFDLGRGMRSSKAGDLASYKPDVLPDGAECRAVIMIKDDVRIGDKRIGFEEWPMPVGIVTKADLHDDNGNQATSFVYYSMLDVIRLVSSGDLKISGIRYEGGHFSADTLDSTMTMTELISSIQNTTADKSFAFYRSKALLNLALDLKLAAKSMPENTLCIMHERLLSPALLDELAAQKFTTHEELISRVQHAQILQADVATYLNVVDTVLPVYKTVAAHWTSSMPIGETINVWYEAIKSCGFVDEADFYKDRTIEGVLIPGVERHSGIAEPVAAAEHSASEPVEVAKPVTSFSPAPAVAPAPAPAPVAPAPTAPAVGVLKSIVPGMQFMTVVLGADTVAMCATEIITRNTPAGPKSYRRYVVLDKGVERDIPSEDVIGSISLLSLMAHVTHDLIALKNGKQEQVQLFFETDNAMVAFRNELNMLGKKMV